ncbi:MAG TPA: phage major capsid protein, partial [Bacillota bacterium]|nr:phage major capsid protein [Bacillota bacterium]
ESDQKLEKDELDKLEAELRDLESEKKDIEKRRAIAEGIQTGTVQTRNVATFGRENPENRATEVDKYDTVEYRKAFMEYVTRGARSDILEFRTDATTGLTDIGAVIPTTILDRIVERMQAYGDIWRRVTKTSVQGGVQIPVSSAKPVATWVAAGTPTGTMADKQKKEVNGKIMFGYHKLQCRVAVELVAGTVAMPVFESTISDNIAEAMVKALEEAIISGTGTGEPRGITGDLGIPAAQIVEVVAADFSKYKTWATLMGKVPRAYRNGVVLIMNDADWNTHIVGMVDANGQPVARVTYNLDGTIQERFLGREVIPVEDLLPSIDAATPGDVVAILVRLQDYMVNTNMAITYRRYFDENTDEWISKATMIADGKLADPNGVVLVKLKASSSSSSPPTGTG